MTTRNESMAPQSLWSPNLLLNIDYQCFEKTKEEKSDAVAAKWRHKKFMERHGINFKKFLNIPQHRIEHPIIITT